MDLDVAQVRAFVDLAGELHFGRTAARLHLTQQALSKRIQRLEATVGATLLERTHQNVELTPAGRRFLPAARALLAAADAAKRAAAPTRSPLRVDVWGPVQLPLRLVRDLADAHPEHVLELSMRRGLTSALDALERAGIDAAFGRPHDLGRPWPAGLSRRLVGLEPIGVAVLDSHPLADRPVVGADDLRPYGLWLPFAESPPELVGLLRAYARRLDLTVTATPLNLGVEHTLAELRRRPELVTPIGAQWTLPARFRTVPLRPTPYLPWSLVWRTGDAHPALRSMIDELSRPVAFDPASGWLPDADRADLP